MIELKDKIFNFFTEYPYSKSIIVSVIILIVYYIIKKTMFNNIDRKKIPKVEKTFRKKRIHQYLRYAAFFTLVLFWFSHLQVLFVSLIAIAAAIVIAFKELIMCVTGGILIRSSRPFVNGQRIEIDEIRGFVIESGLLVTRLLEIGPEKNSQQTTGDIITIPNSLVLAEPVKNESYFKGYSIKSFQFKIADLTSVESFENNLLEKAQTLCEPFLDKAKASISHFCDKEGIAIPVVDPRTKILLDDDKTNFIILLKVPVQNSTIATLEQELNRFYLDWRIKKDKEQ